jgi:hypothetical protein
MKSTRYRGFSENLLHEFYAFYSSIIHIEIQYFTGKYLKPDNCQSMKAIVSTLKIFDVNTQVNYLIILTGATLNSGECLSSLPKRSYRILSIYNVPAS